MGCQPNPQQVPLPTQVVISTASATPFPTRVVRVIPTKATTPTFTPRPATLTPFPSPTFVQIPTLPASFTFGQSVFGRSLVAHRFGDGEDVLMLVGGIHGGWESNTVALMNELIIYFEANPTALLPSVSLMIIPQLNPDGVARGHTLEGRFNDHRVDLNRNWGCGWEAVAYFQNQEVSPGVAAFSEPESQALSKLILETRPSAVLFYHSAADGVFAGNCNDQDAGSNAMSAVLGKAAGYSYGAEFTSYKVTGTAPSWVVSAGIASADVELATWRTSEFDRNLRGILAVQCWMVQREAPCV